LLNQGLQVRILSREQNNKKMSIIENNLVDIIVIFKLLKDEIINQYLCKNAIDSLREDSKFDYMKYFEENMVSDEKLEKTIISIISDNENEKVITDIENGNHKKIGVLVKKVLDIVGKGANAKKIDLMISVQIDIRKRILRQINILYSSVAQ
jgi:aspartyl-tRNA synthetase